MVALARHPGPNRLSPALMSRSRAIGPVDDDEHRRAAGRGPRAVIPPGGIADPFDGRQHHRHVLGRTARQHRVDRDLLCRDRDRPVGDDGHRVLRIPVRRVQHGPDPVRGGRDHRQPVRPPPRMTEFHGVRIVGHAVPFRGERSCHSYPLPALPPIVRRIPLCSERQGMPHSERRTPPLEASPQIPLHSERGMLSFFAIPDKADEYRSPGVTNSKHRHDRDVLDPVRAHSHSRQPGLGRVGPSGSEVTGWHHDDGARGAHHGAASGDDGRPAGQDALLIRRRIVP